MGKKSNSLKPLLALAGVLASTLSVACPNLQRFYDSLEREPLALVEALEGLMDDPSCRSVVITGSGGFFSAGGPIDEFADAIDDGTIGQVTSEMTGLSLIHI